MNKKWGSYYPLINQFIGFVVFWRERRRGLRGAGSMAVSLLSVASLLLQQKVTLPQAGPVSSALLF
ncbi:hypothetical protein V3429_00410 [Aeromonas jandaei]|uniref:hypothetical protein n=1 Tax=Aeromonas TaxID=642 RepID=UPI001C227AAE|nr:hypothetical protein [Aeromonas sp. FDAARGOS 1410]QXC36587.1 hypothetical protein I6L40_11590 [Aeromonas sp. FDAARGOS 1410]